MSTMASIFSRQSFDNGDDFVVVDGNRSFWWTRVWPQELTFTSSKLTLCTDWRNSEMVYILRHILPVLSIHDRRLLACETKNRERPSTSGIPSGEPPRFLDKIWLTVCL